jgi:hypothetical protein
MALAALRFGRETQRLVERVPIGSKRQRRPTNDEPSPRSGCVLARIVTGVFTVARPAPPGVEAGRDQGAAPRRLGTGVATDVEIVACGWRARG